jgi:hypothetical protein
MQGRSSPMIGERVLSVIEYRMMVPWYPGELNQVEEQGLNFGLPVDCTPPVFVSPRSRLGPSEVEETGEEVQLMGNFDGFGQRCREEEEVGELGVDRQAPLNSYDPSPGGGSGYSDWVT